MKTIIFLIIAYGIYYYRNNIKGKVDLAKVTNFKELKDLNIDAFISSKGTSVIPTYSGESVEIDKDKYRRFIFIANKSGEEIKDAINSYYNFQETEKKDRRSFRLGEKNDWHILLVDETLTNSDFFNLVLWLGDDLDKSWKNKNCLGYALHKSREYLNFMFKEDGIAGRKNMLIGSFENDESFFINQNRSPGQVQKSSLVNFSFHQIKEEIEFSGFDITSVFYLHYDKFYVGI